VDDRAGGRGSDNVELRALRQDGVEVLGVLHHVDAEVAANGEKRARSVHLDRTERAIDKGLELQRVGRAHELRNVVNSGGIIRTGDIRTEAS
jgi:hypothetical protein